MADPQELWHAGTEALRTLAAASSNREFDPAVSTGCSQDSGRQAEAAKASSAATCRRVRPAPSLLLSAVGEDGCHVLDRRAFRFRVHEREEEALLGANCGAASGAEADVR